MLPILNTALFTESYAGSRRRFLRQSGVASVSGVAIAMLSGISTSAYAGQSSDAVQQDIRVLNTAIAAEHEAVCNFSRSHRKASLL